jgi:hydroxypyruvate isomerase
LAELGYNGFIGHEFIPTSDPASGLAQAVRICEQN